MASEMRQMQEASRHAGRLPKWNINVTSRQGRNVSSPLNEDTVAALETKQHMISLAAASLLCHLLYALFTVCLTHQRVTSRQYGKLQLHAYFIEFLI